MSASENPLEELIRRREEARQAGDPCTDLCALATVSHDGQPSCRILVVREINTKDVTVYCSRTSPKWREIQETHRYELLLFWPTILGQVRLRGTFEELTVDDIADQWRKREHDAKLLDHFYDRFQAQSEVLEDREELVAGVQGLRRELREGTDFPPPASAAGLRLIPDRVEIWRGSEDRLHHRVAYEIEDGLWRRHWLVP